MVIDKLDKWSNELTLEFIQLYKSHPVLWDPKHKSHKNRYSLLDAWRSIAKQISADVSVEALRRKKASLMATYNPLVRKIRQCQTNDVFAPTWFAFDAIDSFCRTKKIPSLSSEETDLEQFNKYEITENEEVINDDTEDNSDPLNDDTEDNSDPLVGETSQDADFVLPQSAQNKRGREGASPVELNVSKHLKPTSDILASRSTESQTRQTEIFQDVPALYAQLLAAKLRRLSKKTQLILQNKIDNLIFETELQEIDTPY